MTNPNESTLLVKDNASEKISEQLSRRKKILEGMGIFSKLYYIPCVGIAVSSYFTKGGANDSQGLLCVFLVGPVWNLTDSARAIVASKYYFDEAKKSILNANTKQWIAHSNHLYFKYILPSATLAGFIPCVISAVKSGFQSVVWNSNHTLGMRSLLALSNFAFGFDLFLEGLFKARSFYRAHLKSNDLGLITEALKKYEVSLIADNISPEKKERIKNKLSALICYFITNKPELNLPVVFANHVAYQAVNASIPAGQHCFFLQYARFLEQKQNYKWWKNLIDMVSDMIGALGGALFAGLSMLDEERAKLHLFISIIAYSVCMLLKNFQVAQYFFAARPADPDAVFKNIFQNNSEKINRHLSSQDACLIRRYGSMWMSVDIPATTVVTIDDQQIDTVEAPSTSVDKPISVSGKSKRSARSGINQQPAGKELDARVSVR